PTTNGEILIFDALLGSFITPPNPDEVQGTNLGNGVPVFDNQVQRELFFNTLVAGDYITINEDNGEITFNVHPAATVVADIPARDALVPYIGQQVFVNDTGNGENAFYIWTGAQWVV